MSNGDDEEVNGTSGATSGSGSLDFSGFASPLSAGQSYTGGFMAPTVDDPSTSASQTGNMGLAGGGGGMNWAGLSQGLAKLSEALKSSGGAASSDPMQGSRSVSSTIAPGSLQPAGGRDSGGLASMLNSRNQLGQALINAAMTGKGRGKSGQGLLG